MKFFRNLIISAAAGAGFAYFLTSKKGQELKEKATEAYEDYKADPEAFQKSAKDKVAEYSASANKTFQEYKTKFESGELTTDDVLNTVKEKAAQAGEYVNKVVADVQDQFQGTEKAEPRDVTEPITEAEVEDIIIDYPEADLAEEEVLADEPEATEKESE
ncbi:YtxH domain-containing protein [Streptococcus caprae]|uniref:YtxH domain-containing protein n=1 Tax=Streptococcus caprae TaxID=1640501 RepID=A0ABV8CY14_9STRE